MAHGHTITRSSDTEEVVKWVAEQTLPEGTEAEVVGAWVWVEFPHKPAEEIRRAFREAGFNWIRKRSKWAHPCGVFTRGSVTDPRDKYGAVRIATGGTAA